MNISLSLQQRAFVSSEVNSGRYASAGEVIKDALALLERRQTLDQELGKRLESMDRGELGDLDALRERLSGKSREKQNLAA